MDELDLEHVRVMRVKPGDVVVLTADAALSPEAVEHATDLLKERFPDNECIVVSGAELSVVRPR